MVYVSSPATEMHVEGTILQVPNTKLLIDDQEVGTATLYITENDVLWSGGMQPQGVPVPTVSVLYPTITMQSVLPEPVGALFLLLNYELKLPELTNPDEFGEDGDENSDDEEIDPEYEAAAYPIHPYTELRFIPPNSSLLSPMYKAMCQGQALHPKPEAYDPIASYYAHLIDDPEFYGL